MAEDQINVSLKSLCASSPECHPNLIDDETPLPQMMQELPPAKQKSDLSP